MQDEGPLSGDLLQLGILRSIPLLNGSPRVVVMHFRRIEFQLTTLRLDLTNSLRVGRVLEIGKNLSV